MSNSIEITYGGNVIYSGYLSDKLTLPTAGKIISTDIVIDAIEPLTPEPVLENNAWDIISSVAQEGNGASYWSVGDAKSVLLSGTCGTMPINTSLYVYIIGINHRGVNGITFLCCKTALSGGVDVCFTDSKCNSNGGTSGNKYFQMNHWGSYNYGGWKGCDMRYDILGSTSTAPSGYGSTPTTSKVGYDANSTTATSPKANTLMSCLPSDLRAVMRPMTIHTDNKGNASNIAANVTTSVDYLPLLAEFEIYGTRSEANQYEQNNQSQYSYFSAGNSKIKYRQSATSTAASWWCRSPYYRNNSWFNCVYSEGIITQGNTSYSYGVAPIFLV